MLKNVFRFLGLTTTLALCACNPEHNGRSPPPTGLSYPSPFVFTVAERISPPPAPTVTGVVSKYSVSPAFPAGIVLDAWAGVISGTPTEASPLGIYTITASNESGVTTATVTMTVNAAPSAIAHGAPRELDQTVASSDDAVLLDLGHADSVVTLDREGSRLLSVDRAGRWVLWDTQNAENLSHGNLACGADCEGTAELAGSTFTVRVEDGLELRAATDGHVIGRVATSPSWWKLAADGSYVVVGDSTELALLTRTGAPLLSLAGNYADAVAFAASSELRVARGAAGVDVIERIAIPTGAVTTTRFLEGTFHSWFVDGERFLTTASNTVWIYSRAGAQHDVKVLSRGSPARLGGLGDRYWTLADDTLDVYEVGASATPVASYPIKGSVIPSGATIALLTSDHSEIGIVDLSGDTAARTVHAAPITDAGWTAYAAGPAGKPFVGNRSGVVVELPPSAAPRYFALGKVHDIAGGGTRAFVAVSCAILYFDTAEKTEHGLIEFASSELDASGDGTTLLAVARDRGPSCGAPNIESTVFAVPSEIPLATFAGEDSAIRLSPNGARIAVSNGAPHAETQTSLYMNGSLTAVVQGWPVGWLDDGRLVVNRYTDPRSSSGGDQADASTPASAIVVDAAGRILSALAAPDITEQQTAFDAASGVVAGNYVVFVSGAEVRAARR